MEEKKYHLPESNPEEGMVMEPSPTYARTHTSVAYSAPSSTLGEEWEEDEETNGAYDTDGYPLGRSLEQVMAHCEEVEEHWDDPNYWMTWDEFDDHLRKTIPGWR